MGQPGLDLDEVLTPPLGVRDDLGRERLDQPEGLDRGQRGMPWRGVEELKVGGHHQVSGQYRGASTGREGRPTPLGQAFAEYGRIA